jgi:hypothetical protein
MKLESESMRGIGDVKCPSGWNQIVMDSAGWSEMLMIREEEEEAVIVQC